jgi:serine/threonine-protein kinase/endoribonuclease IRE1
MIAFYILTKGQHPFGKGEQVILTNLLGGNPVNLKMWRDHLFAKDLISWMLSKDPEDRPSAEEALQHPYLKSREQQFKLQWGMWDYIKGKDEENSRVVKELNNDTSDWRNRMDGDVLDYLSYDYIHKKPLKYDSSWKHCVRLIRNVKEHWGSYPKTESEASKVGVPQEFFLNLFPDLVLTIYKIARSRDDLKKQPGLDLKESRGKYFSSEASRFRPSS